MHSPLVHVSVAHLWQVYPQYYNNTSEKVTGENMKEMEIHGPSLHPPATGPRSTYLYDETTVLFTRLQRFVSTCAVKYYWQMEKCNCVMSVAEFCRYNTVSWYSNIFQCQCKHNSETILISSDHCLLCHFSIKELWNTVMNKVVAFLTSWETVIRWW